MRPFALFGALLILIGGLAVLLAIVAYSSTGGACLGGRPCPSGYSAWYEGRVLIWGVFGALLLVFGVWLLARPRRRWGRFGPYRGARVGAPFGPAGRGRAYGGGPPRFCPHCGARNGPHFQFCHRCGAPLGGPMAGAAPPPPPP